MDFEVLLSLTKHLDEKKHNGGRPKKAFKCSLCNTSFKYKQGCVRHLENVHGNREKYGVKCGTCNALFASNNHFNRHIYGVHRGL